MSSGVYQIINCISGKKYIGESVNIEKRWEEHKRRASNIISKKSPHFYK